MRSGHVFTGLLLSSLALVTLGAATACSDETAATAPDSGIETGTD